jgi:cytosine deaminase
MACEKMGAQRLTGLDMYVTLEPCTMCAAAISFARIRHVYVGTEDEKGGAILNGVKFYEQKTCHHRPQIYSGILQEECAEILISFFKSKRQKL